jgi:nitroreductase
MDFFKALEGRTSVRAFLPKKVDKALLEKILKAAGHSPSFMNTQPWEVFVVMGKKKDEISADLLKTAQEDQQRRPDFSFPTAWPQAPEKRSNTHRLRRFEVLGIDPKDQVKIKAGYLRNFQFFDAPCGIFIGMDKALTSWSMFDLGLFVHGFLLALYAEGLGGCPQAMLTAYPDIIRRHLDIPENIKIAIGISLGYSDNNAAANKYRSQRIDVKEFVRWYD